MEIYANPFGTLEVIMFKIDLIVWKYFIDFISNEQEIAFKIDLIVWKLIRNLMS